MTARRPRPDRHPDDDLHQASDHADGATMMAGSSYTVAELGHTVERLEARLELLPTLYPTKDRYEADLRTATEQRHNLANRLDEQRRSTAEDIAAATSGLTARVAAIETRNKARAAFIGSGFMALIVAVVAGGVTKGFGIG
ncbi:MAG: hypothetical protein M3Y91_15450 [Actinomycetota bacterium]|nr:hypothetical protein [Actinomycetota bacterium]